MPRVLQSMPRRRGAWIALLLLPGVALTAILPGTARAIGGPRPVTVTVEGEVRRPGSYTLPHDATLSTLVVAAGGYTDNADLAAAILTRESANAVSAPLSHPRLMKGSPADLPLTDGDTLRIPARTPGARARTRARPAGDEAFTGPSNYGLTGLLETPTARVMKENRYRLGVTQVRPYRYYFGTVGLYDRLEVNGRVTQVLGVPGFDNNSVYGDFKDKAVDVKFQFVKEGKYFPAVAVVISDPTGTRVYASQSIVASKRIYPFDFTVGMGNGRLGKNPLPQQLEGFRMELFSAPRTWAREALPFGGVQFAATDRITLLAEYSPIRYERQTQDPAQKRYFPAAVRSPFNVGARFKPLKWLEIDASWQRGNELGISASASFDIGRPLVPIFDAPYLERPEAARDPLSDRIALALSEAGFSDIGVASDGLTLRIDAQNDRYFFTPRAAQVLFETVAPFVPSGVEYVRVRFTENGIPVAETAVSAPVLSGTAGGADLPGRIAEHAGFRTSGIEDPIRPTTRRRLFGYYLKPSFETFLNDPSGYFKYRFGAAGGVQLFPWKGGTAVLELDAYPLNNVSSSVAPLSIPIRSDVAEYKRQDVSLGRLLFDQMFATRAPVWVRAGVGMLERMFGGMEGEIGVPLRNGRFLAGASGSLVRKRSPGGPIGFRDSTNYHTALFIGRLNLPEIDSALDVKAGRFLAGDRGVRVTVSKFIRGVTLSAWYSATGTSMFSDPYNRGYHDKGISVDIPIRLFTGHDSRTSYRYALSPWTRDVAQDIDRYRPLFDLIGRNAGVLLDSDGERRYK